MVVQVRTLILLLTRLSLLPGKSWWYLVACIVLTGCASTTKSNDVSINGDQIYYNGRLDANLNSQLFELYERAELKPTTLNITSGGGRVDLGLDLGEWVLEKRLDVYIPELCVSSCANYIFTAGRTVRLGESAMIYWHGSPVIDDLLDGTAQEKARWEGVLASLKKLGLGGADPKAYWREVRTRNRKFFRKAGVSSLITIPHLFADTASKKEIRKYTSYTQVGMYYSLGDMSRYGRSNVSIDNSQNWDPASSVYYVNGVIRINLIDGFDEKLRAMDEKISRVVD